MHAAWACMHVLLCSLDQTAVRVGIVTGPQSAAAATHHVPPPPNPPYSPTSPHTCGFTNFIPPFPGHFREDGWNGLEFLNVANCWANDLLFINSDLALMAGNIHFCTFSNIRVTATGSRVRQYMGHHAITVAKSSTDTLVTSFLIAQQCYHDLSVVS